MSVILVLTFCIYSHALSSYLLKRLKPLFTGALGETPLDSFLVPAISSDILQRVCRKVDVSLFAVLAGAHVNNLGIDGPDSVATSCLPRDALHFQTFPANPGFAPCRVPVFLVHCHKILLPPLAESLWVEPAGVSASLVHLARR